MSRPAVVFSREQLLNAVWGQDRAITDRAVDVYVLRLRQKIERDPAAPVLIIRSAVSVIRSSRDGQWRECSSRSPEAAVSFRHGRYKGRSGLNLQMEHTAASPTWQVRPCGTP